MSELKTKGKITNILEIESGTSKAGKEWKKQNFVIDIGAQYNPEVCFQVFGDDKIDMLSSNKIGDNVEVLFNVSSREFNGKYYHNIDAWAINNIDNKPSNKPVEDDDLPF